MTWADNEPAVRQVTGWLSEGYATWGARVGGQWVEYPVLPDRAPTLTAVLERRLPERRAAA